MEQFKQFIDPKLFIKENHYFVACSSGVDSTVLLNILIKKKLKVTAIHVNYNLRGEDSINDEQFISDFCSEKKIPFIVKSIQLNETLKSGGNLQEIARKVRYDWFYEILKNQQNKIVLGHHKNDQIETFWMNLSRNSGVMGLASMLEINNGILRPLLDKTKVEIYDFAKENDIKWREDASNKTIKYKRNLFRNEIIPFLEREIPSINESVVLLIKKFQQKQLELEKSVSPLIETIKSINQLEISNYLKLNEFEKIELMRQLGQPHQLKLMLDKIVKSQKGKSIQLKSNEFKFTSVTKESTYFSFQTNDLKNTPILLIETVLTIPSTFNKDEIYLDSKKIVGELKIRRWKEGDRINSIGMKGSQLISDVISNHKLNKNQKDNTFIVHDTKNIHWCVGLKIGRNAIATDQSTSVTKCSLLIE